VVFYVFLGLVLLGVVFLVVRSPTFKAIVRGRGADPGRFGNQFDHLMDRGSGTGWRDDGGGGKRDSQRDPPQSRRHGEHY
jgi:hypothetical protein